LHRWRGHIQDVRVVLRAMLIPLPLMALIFFEPDFGTTAIIGGLAALMLFVAGMNARHIAVAAGAGLIVGVPMMVMEEYRVRRLFSFLDPWKNAQGDGYHTIQSWLAMHSGGLWGQGLGNSIAKLHFLPEPWTDYIGAVIGEELGFSMLVVLIGLYGMLVWRGLYIASRARDAFSSYLAVAITSMLGFEAFFNLGVILGLLPPKGLVLPFISYGSTAMMSNLWAIGILLSIAAEADETPISAGWARPTPVRRPAAATGK
ncbi:MAG: cell division protein FtsW, partial [Myxococcota bacterium]